MPHSDCWATHPHQTHTSAGAHSAHFRRRTLSTLSNLSGGPDAGAYTGNNYDYDHLPSDAENNIGGMGGGVPRSMSMMSNQRRRTDSFTLPRLWNKRSVTLGHVSFALDSNGKATPSRLTSPMSIAPGNADSFACPMDITYADLQRHLGWATGSQSPHVTTSFIFFWALWKALRRYQLGVKRDVEFAVVDARRLYGRARTASEVLREVDESQYVPTPLRMYDTLCLLTIVT